MFSISEKAKLWPKLGKYVPFLLFKNWSMNHKHYNGALEKEVLINHVIGGLANNICLSYCSITIYFPCKENVQDKRVSIKLLVDQVLHGISHKE